MGGGRGGCGARRGGGRAWGTPPLAADNPGYREVLKERSCQLIFPVDDDRELAARLERLCQVGEEWASLQEWCGQEWVRYDWRRLVVPIEAFYARALGQKKSGPSSGSRTGLNTVQRERP